MKTAKILPDYEESVGLGIIPVNGENMPDFVHCPIVKVSVHSLKMRSFLCYS